MIKTIPMPNFWRPMVENDFGGLIQLRCAQWKVGSQFVSPRQVGDNYNTKGCIPTVEEKDDTVKVAYTYHMPTVRYLPARLYILSMGMEQLTAGWTIIR